METIGTLRVEFLVENHLFKRGQEAPLTERDTGALKLIHSAL
jgi:hypothetical protein